MKSKVVQRILNDINNLPFYKKWKIQFNGWIYTLPVKIKYTYRKFLCFVGIHSWKNIDETIIDPPLKSTEWIAARELHQCKFCPLQKYFGVGLMD